MYPIDQSINHTHFTIEGLSGNQTAPDDTGRMQRHLVDTFCTLLADAVTDDGRVANKMACYRGHVVV